MKPAPQAIRAALSEARPATPAQRREIARTLGLSEAEVVAAHGEPFHHAESPMKARRLRAEWPRLVATLEALGPVTALTCNGACTIEKPGLYTRTAAIGNLGLVLGGAISLRAAYEHWAHGFAVEQRLADGTLRRALQFFDGQGDPTHEVVLGLQSRVAAWFAIVDAFAAPELGCDIELAPPSPCAAERPDAEVDVRAFGAGWTSMHDPHEFPGLLSRFALSPLQALRLAPSGYAAWMPPATAHDVLARAAQDGTSIVVSVGNRGTVQTHAGPVRRIDVMGPWLRVRDAGFKLHLREDCITHAWLVKKPSAEGLVHSLELFDADGQAIATLSGERQPGQSERCEWRCLLDSLSTEAESCAP